MPGLNISRLGLGLQGGRVGGGGAAPALSISGTPVLTATEDDAYDGFTATASGGTAPYAYSLVGTWPAGITINSSTGAVSGTPTESGSFTGLSVRVTDDASATADLDAFTIEVEAAAASIEATATASIANNAAPTFSGLSFGAEHADRVMHAFISYQDGAAGSAFTGCTIGGVAATKIAQATSAAGTNCALYSAAVPTGASGDVVPSISNAGATLDCQVSLLRAVGFAATATDTAAGLAGGSSFTRNNDCPAGGVQIFGCYRDGTNGSGNVDWTNVDELTELHFDTNQKTQSAAARINASAQTNQAITATNPGGGVVSFYMAGGSFAAL
ncbi:MAG: hypothetical protein EOS70_23500 [Mesorhizobium sp.]|uniref:putative Ig domain-containing protein n=1 Tax=Mesorhizobium sp. TaxID=1871066 RepID=UPI000FEA95A8|nr:putative Ig domain-containing protein [Mesorhizobium sp.]RWC29857.1 MAG: hypothetical protein EOS70_23500 [Mesorhizobium sp.]